MTLHLTRARRRTGRTLAAACGLVALVAALAPLSSASAATVPLGTYSAALPISPFPTVAGSSDPSGLGFPVAFTNTSPNGYLLTAVQVDLPAGFVVTGSPTVDAPGWSATTSGSTVRASAGSAVGDGIPSGQRVVLRFDATAPAATGSYVFATAAQGLVASTGVAGDFSRSADDPAVTVHPHANVVTCAPSEVCDTGEVGSASDTQARIVTTTGAVRDVLAISVDPATDAACTSRLQAAGRSEQVTFNSLDTTRTLTQTLRLDKTVVNEVPNNGVGRYQVCYNTQASPSRTTFVDRSGNRVTAGFLPDCSTTGLPAGNPCVQSTTKNKAGDIVLTLRAPGGDPTNIVGLPVTSFTS